MARCRDGERRGMVVDRERTREAVISVHRGPGRARPDLLRSELLLLEAEFVQCKKRIDLYDQILLKIDRSLSDRSAEVDYETLILHQFHQTITQEHGELRRETAGIQAKIDDLKVLLSQPMK
ncbi:hypothetical protein ACFL4G_09750 [Thermodesulfobacteriota bacterium]